MHDQGGDVHMSTQTADPLYGLWCGTNSSIDDGATMVHVWDGAEYQVELVTSKSDGAHHTGI